MEPFLVLQLRPEDPTAESEFDAMLRYGGLGRDEVVRVRLDRESFPKPDLDDFSAILVGGSPFELSTPEAEKSDLQQSIEAGFRDLIGLVVDRDFPFLGACSGNSLLGAHCGASLSGRYSEPVGAVEVNLTDAGRADPLLEGFPDQFRVLVGHKEACDDLPPGADLLVTSDHCPVQMFRVKRNVYATQFHPEADAEGFVLRIKTYRRHGYFPPEQADALIEAVSGERTPMAQALLARFVDRYRG